VITSHLRKMIAKVIILSLWGHLMQHLKMNDLVYHHNSRINSISCLFLTCPHGQMANKLVKVLQQPYKNRFT